MSDVTRRSIGIGEITTLFAVSALGLLLRAPDALLNPQFIAEDGTTFFMGQFGRLLPPLFGPVQGYWVFLDRLVAWYASFSPVVLVPLIYNLSATVLAAASIAYFCCRAREMFHPLASLAVLLLVPMVSGIMLDNITHLQWFSQLALASASLLPLSPSARNSGITRVFELAFLALVAFTGPFAILCSLVYLFLQTVSVAAGLARLTRIRDGLREYLRSLDVPSLVVTLVAGAIVLFLARSEHKIPLPVAHKLVSDFFVVVAGVGLQVHALGPVLFPQVLFAWFQVALFGIIVLVRMSARVRMGCFALLLYGWLVLLAGFLKTQSLGGNAPDFNYCDTYFFALAIFEWLVLWRVVSVLLRGSQNAPTWMIISALGSAAIAFPYWHIRAALPETNWAQYAKRIEAGETLDVSIYPPHWSFHVTGRQPIGALQSPTAQASADAANIPGFNVAPSAPSSLRIIDEDGHKAVFLHAPGSITFKPRSGNYTISATFGIQSAAVNDPECAKANADGVGASVLVHRSGGQSTIWHREIDPFHAAPDRAPHSLRVENVDANEGDLVEYRVDSGHGGNNTSCDWTYVRDVVFRRNGKVGWIETRIGLLFADGFD